MPCSLLSPPYSSPPPRSSLPSPLSPAMWSHHCGWLHCLLVVLSFVAGTKALALESITRAQLSEFNATSQTYTYNHYPRHLLFHNQPSPECAQSFVSKWSLVHDFTSSWKQGDYVVASSYSPKKRSVAGAPSQCRRKDAHFELPGGKSNSLVAFCTSFNFSFVSPGYSCPIFNSYLDRHHSTHIRCSPFEIPLRVKS